MLKIKQIIIALTLLLSSVMLSNTAMASPVKEGTISYYGGHHHGKKTASGEVFDKHKLTAAHMTLPFGSKVKLTCVSTGKSVVVKINDRGNFAKYGRAFDVSEGAAKALGFVNKGITKVQYEILN